MLNFDLSIERLKKKRIVIANKRKLIDYVVLLQLF